MKITHIVFDWDGTLADTYPVISAAYMHTFQELFLTPIPYDEIKKITSTLANKDTLGYVFGEKKEQAKKIYYKYIENHHTVELQAIPQAKEVLDFCRDSHFDLRLLSNKKRPYLLAETDKLGFTNYFSKIVAAGDCSQDKPHPLAAKAIFNNELPPADSILIVGDGMADWQTARALDSGDKKTHCAIYDPTKTFTQETPDYRLTQLKDIISILKKEVFSHD